MTSAPAPDDAASVVPFSDVVPLKRPDRDTVEGFRAWAQSRDNWVSEPLMPRADYLALDRVARRRYDQRRRAANANIDILDTPMSRRVSEIIEDIVWDNALNRQPGAKPGILVNGGGAQGKTATVCEVVANFMADWEAQHGLAQRDGARNAHEPVVYVRTPAKPTPKSLCRAVLDAIGEPYLKSDDYTVLQRRVHNVLVDLGVRVVVLDDITRLKLHRADDQDVLDLIRDVMDAGATLILVGVGIPSSGLLREGGPSEALADRLVHVKDGAARMRRLPNEDDDQRTQTERRFKLVHLTNFRYETDDDIAEWTTFLAGVGDQLRLYGVDSTSLLADGVPDELYRRSGGVVGTVVRLVSEMARVAMRNPDPETGHELMTRAVLDSVVADFAAEDGRVDQAGEVPWVPPHIAVPLVATTAKTAPKPGRRRRITVYDDGARAAR